MYDYDYDFDLDDYETAQDLYFCYGDVDVVSDEDWPEEGWDF